MHATRRCGGGQGRTAVAARGYTERSLPGGAAGGGGGPPWGRRRLHLESSKLTLPPSMSSSGTRLGRAAGSWACGSGSVVARCARVSSARGAGAEFAHQPTRSPATLEALACRIFVHGWCSSNFGGGVGCPGLGHNQSHMAPIARRGEIISRMASENLERRPGGAPARRGDLCVFAPALKRWAEWGLGCQTRRNNALNIFSHYQPTQD